MQRHGAMKERDMCVHVCVAYMVYRMGCEADGVYVGCVNSREVWHGGMEVFMVCVCGKQDR